MHRLPLGLFLFALATPLLAADVPTWPQWRGPLRNGAASPDAKAWPDRLNAANFKKSWEVTDLGPSYSGPIVSGDKIFTTETVDKKIEVVKAFDRKTGKELWKASWKGAIEVPFFANKNGSWIRSTPALDGNRLYVAGIQDLLVCLDATTGKELWKFDFVAEFKSSVPTFGCASSPLIDDTGIYIQAGGCVAKLDKKTGKSLWTSLKDGGGMNGSAFSCPVIAKLAGKEQLVVQTRTQLAGLDQDTGKELWKRDVPTFRGMNILTPVISGDTLLTSTYGGTTQGFKVQSSDGGFRTENAWSFKYEGYMSTPVVVGGHAYFLGKDQKAICVDLKAGKETWRSEKRYGQYWSLVAHKDKILALDQKGTLYLLNANPKEMEILGEIAVSKNETWAHLAVSGDDVIVRDLFGLTVFRWASEK